MTSTTDAQPAGLTRFNDADVETAREQLFGCCSSSTWADQLLAGRPYACLADVLAAADAALGAMAESDVDDALAGHPRIGERLTAGHGAPMQVAQSRHEQSGVEAADPAVLEALAEGNRAYEARFGQVYLVFASGKTAQQMLQILHDRLGNAPGTERAVLRGELAKINALRLTRLLAS